MSTELVQIETLNAIDLFEKGTAKEVVYQIKKTALSEIHDVETKKGRDGIKSLAHKIARSKTALDNLGKDHVAGLKKKTKAIDSERKVMRDSLDDLKEEVKKPLTEYEQREAKRIQEHKDNIEKLRISVSFNAHTATSSEIEKKTEEVKLIPINSEWEEFAPEAESIIASSLAYLGDALVFRKEQEEELENERKEKARVNDLQKRMRILRKRTNPSILGIDRLDQLESLLKEVESIEIDNSWQEHKEEAKSILEQAYDNIKLKIEHLESQAHIAELEAKNKELEKESQPATSSIISSPPSFEGLKPGDKISFEGAVTSPVIINKEAQDSYEKEYEEKEDNSCKSGVVIDPTHSALVALCEHGMINSEPAKRVMTAIKLGLIPGVSWSVKENQVA